MRNHNDISHLSHADLLLTLGACQQLLACTKANFSDFFASFMADNFPPCLSLLARFCLPTKNSPAKPIDFINISFPQSWIQEYTQNDYFSSDPVKQNLMTAPSPGFCIWQDAIQKGSLDHVGDYYQTRLREYHLLKSASFCAKTPENSVLNVFALSSKAISNDFRCQTILLFLMPHFEQAFNREAIGNKNNKPDNFLTNREIDVLSWAVYGKTNGTIATLLNISERTVKFHIKNIMEKLNASNRAQAVAIALQNGIISL